MRPNSALVRSQWFLCLFVSAYASSITVINSQPWHVSCPVRCVCQIKPWFSADSVYHEAPTVDCNDLLMTHLPSPLPTNTHTLRLQSNLLSGLESGALHSLPNLTELDLSQNRFNSVAGLTASPSLAHLLSLHLEENSLRHLPHASFSSLPALQELFLSHNHLYSLAPGAFVGLDSLLRLHINNNRLTAIDPQWFRALPRLEVLMLGGNPVEVFPEQGFQALRSLRSLMLGGMGLRGLAEKALDGLDRLESLSFYDNLLTKVPTQALRRVQTLKFLDLNKNRIKLVETGDFQEMAHLKELGLNNMEELVSIERAALDNLPELTKLEITNNPRLSYIHPQAFLQLSRLESLMLNSNSLSALHHDTLLSLPSLQEVSLHSNPLRCDCLFRWAAEKAFHQHTATDTDTHITQTGAIKVSRLVRFIQPQATLCSEPPELRARSVKEVSSREMSASCLPMIPPGILPTYIGGRGGATLALHCRALAEPPPTIYWVTPSGLRLGQTSTHPSLGAQDPVPSTSPLAAQKSNHSFSRNQSQDHTMHNNSGRYRLLPEGTLEITMVTAKEAGLYTCIAENALGADTHSVTVGVHSRKKKRRRQMPSNVRGYPAVTAEGNLKVEEFGQNHVVVSWKNGHNLPVTRLLWKVMYPDAHTPTYITRILAGTQSFNLTHLLPGTFYHVCLHLGNREDTKHASRRTAEGRRCVSVRTKEAPETRRSPPLGPELTSTALTLLLLAVILLVLASQGWDESSSEAEENLETKPQDQTPGWMTDEAPGDSKHQPWQDGKESLHRQC